MALPANPQSQHRFPFPFPSRHSHGCGALSPSFCIIDMSLGTRRLQISGFRGRCWTEWHRKRESFMFLHFPASSFNPASGIRILHSKRGGALIRHCINSATPIGGKAARHYRTHSHVQFATPTVQPNHDSCSVEHRRHRRSPLSEKKKAGLSTARGLARGLDDLPNQGQVNKSTSLMFRSPPLR